jgi:hypothetical protein
MAAMLRDAPFLLMLLAALPAGAVASMDEPVRVTTESWAYCAELQSRLGTHPGALPEPARSLADEGQRLCKDGHVRTGIAKLRRALRAVQQRS